MYKKWMFAVVVMLFPVLIIANHSFGAKSDDSVETLDLSDHTIRYSSAQFTQPEPAEQQEIKQDSSFEGYTKAAESDELVLFVNKKSLAIKLQNKKTGYTWGSGIDHPENYRLNKTWEQIVQSAITVDFTDRQGKLRTESILTNDSTPTVKLSDNGFSADVFLFQSKLKFQLDVQLKGNELDISIPQEKLKEDKRNKLVSLQIYPFLGSVNENDIQGYMFIPDGSGALIRYDKSVKSSGTPFVGSIYGVDEGIKNKTRASKDVLPVQQIKMPIFGAVHGVKQNGFIAIVEDGFSYGDIVAYPAGASTDFNRVSSKFNYRYEYFQPTSKSSTGMNVYQKEMNKMDVKLKYIFLSDKDADYVGMAKSYRNYLADHDLLTKQEDQANVRLEFLGGEMKKGLLWNSVIPMTPIDRIPHFTNELRKNGVEDMFVVYKGWSDGGLTGSLPGKFPMESKLGSKKDAKATIDTLKNDNIPMYFYTDYTKAYEGASGFSGSKDVAKKISSETISHKVNDLTSYYLSPKKALDIAKKDSKNYESYGMENLAVDSSGFTLFSDFSKSKKQTRLETLETYKEIFSFLNKNVGKTALYEPNVYAWSDAEKYLDIPINSSNYVFETDTVPFMQIVLKGSIPYYAPFTNFNSNQEDQLLRMIEYGAYPSFLLTEEPSHLLAKTPSKNVYTSEFTVWKDDIIKQYKQIQEVLGQVESATIESRHVPENGIVEVTYSNGKTVVVNYTNSIYKKDGVEVSAKGFSVVDKGGEQ
ncbi:DUF5696 domain-containing protein [Lederbergia citri]|uniref:Uncharacterized protein n=1 Tax=Lederbergia citri TaxID=2833580 RepID=A0A942TDR7_9BACI|nr:DUF5696 domain-containing protein [Lederbergia citri]MBS4196091.1 hypothetical protein [Lederbergia citri]